MSKRVWLTLAVAIALSDATARAVIVNGPQGRNLAAPTGTLAGSGWDLQGRYGDYLGTPISDNYFVTAAHFGAVGGPIVMPDGSVHPLTGYSMPISGTDLVLRQVSTPFTAVATLFNPAVDAKLTTADSLVVFGRGTDRGTAIAGRGYDWGAVDHAVSWGTNRYADTVPFGGGYAAGATAIASTFDNNGDPNEATVSVGDSGGGVFVQRNGVWKLVGINYGVELFRASPTGPDLYSAIYDARGLYQEDDDGNWVYLDPATHPTAVPQTWYASYIPDALGAILAGPIGVPEPGVLGLCAVGALVLRRSGRLSRCARRERVSGSV